MIIVTGGMGFIASNIVKALNDRNRTDIIVVDDLTDGSKFANLADCEIADYLDIGEFRTAIAQDSLSPPPDIIFHNGACSVTTEQNGKFMMDLNFTMSKEILHYCQKHRSRLIYASSAAVYGKNAFPEAGQQPQKPVPLNVYGYSKLLFDQYVARHLNEYKGLQVVGLRYFNVYGPREQHKGPMASIAYQMHQQLKGGSKIKLFGAYDGYAAGMQSRDFISVHDIVRVNLWFFDHPVVSGTFDVGTGRSETFLEVAKAVSEAHRVQDAISFIPFPESLKGNYQNYTCANTNKLRAVGFCEELRPVAVGVKDYVQSLIESEI
ncbi:ADP-glyceromanno-heptose 6-epimerase [Aspergillus novoparasiticus]|uniref:ADP-glyceromanno-heptose 6-epimerase n=1 Tax=Aspergillus novoparasiticus TaxID=986946 RepID=A0A5N6EQG5_9EURO|nr:ADP-glyceromanno-heptose 6-epimerase [Aspergillus novoparasiticus]